MHSSKEVVYFIFIFSCVWFSQIYGTTLLTDKQVTAVSDECLVDSLEHEK